MEEIKDTETKQELEQSEKTFTQEEVNEIIKSRLSRVKAEKTEETNKRLDEREAELVQRENRLTAAELIQKKNLPPESIELVNLADKETVSASIDLMEKLFGKKPNAYKPQGGGEYAHSAIEEAFTRK